MFQKCAKRCKSRRVPARKFLEKTREILPRKASAGSTFGILERVFTRLAAGPAARGVSAALRLQEAGRPRIGQKFTTLLSQNSGSKPLPEMRFGSRKQGENENSRSNIAGGFETDARCWNFVSKLFRSRIYELSARTILANLPKVVSKVGELWSVVSGQNERAGSRQQVAGRIESLRTPNSALHVPRTSNFIRFSNFELPILSPSSFIIRTSPFAPARVAAKGAGSIAGRFGLEYPNE
jgi:hypothetical protein